jgi:isoleucyl-tRNA synthetase
LGADTLRLWAASVDYSSDMSIGPQSLSKITEFHNKLRITFKFLIGNLVDFSSEDIISYEDLFSVDRYMLISISNFADQIHQSYDTFNFHKTFALLANFISTECSAFYFDINKDRLYCDGSQSLSRRSVQTTFILLLETLLKSIAPILPFLAEEMYTLIPSELYPLLKFNPCGNLSTNESNISPGNVSNEIADGVFMLGWISLLSPSHMYRVDGRESSESVKSLMSMYDFANRLRREVNIGLNEARLAPLLASSENPSTPTKIGSTNETQIDLFVPPQSLLEKSLNDLKKELELLWIVSKINIRPVDDTFLTPSTQVESIRTLIYSTPTSSGENSVAFNSNDNGEKCLQYHGDLYRLVSITDVSGKEVPCCIVIRLAGGCKCPRCWRYTTPVPELQQMISEDLSTTTIEFDPTLCTRCTDIVYESLN